MEAKDRTRVVVAVAAVVAALAIGVAVTIVLTGDGGGGAGDGRPGMADGDPAAELADAFAAGWVTGDVSAVAFSAASGDVAGHLRLATTDLTPAERDLPASVEVTGLVKADDGNRADATANVTWQVSPQNTWTYDTTISLVNEPGPDGEDAWKVAYGPGTVEPSLGQGEVLRTVRTQAIRGEVLDLAGQPLVGDRDVVVVGIQPSGAPDPAATARQVAQIVEVDAEDLVARVEASPPDQFVEVVTLRRDAYDAIRDQIYPLPGTRFREEKRSLAPSRSFARALLGTVGPASEEIAAGSEGRVAPGDQVGLSGLQAAQDEVLGGTATIRVEAEPLEGGGDARVLEEFAGTPGRSITVTLDQRVQIAADEVMASAPGPAALVAIRVSTGDVLAVSNGPAGADGYNRAMIGRYPPGSVFKIASGLALLANGLTPDTVVDCPATLVVGKEFGNAGGFALGAVPFRTDFARSCNTAFVGEADRITDQQLTDLAGLLGYRDHDLGVPSFGGSVPVGGGTTEHAASMIGQAKVEASPFAVAVASASVANGRSIVPRLIVENPGDAPTFGAALPEPAVTQVRDLMRAVVTEGTGSALAGVPGGEVHGKTGTAEFGSESPPETHAWFTGYQGDVAFAVLVEGGSSGGGVAAPLAASFLTKIAQ